MAAEDLNRAIEETTAPEVSPLAGEESFGVASCPFYGLVRVLAASDVFAVLACAFLALYLRFQGDVAHMHSLPYLYLAPVLTGWRVLMAYNAGLYDFRHRLTLTDHLFGAFEAALWGVLGGYGLLALIQLYYAPDWELSRLASSIDLLLLAGWYAASRGIALAWIRASGREIRVLLVGHLEECRDLARELREHAPRALRVSGICTLEDGPSADDVIGSVDRLGEIPGAERADQIILVGVDLPQPELRDLLLRIDQVAPESYLFPSLDLSILANTRLLSIAGLPLVPLHPAFNTSLYRPMKRLMDIAGATLLLVLTLPLTAGAAAAIRWTSPGPVFFTQERVGLHGRRFRMHKFRTMVPDAEAGSGPVVAYGGDPRVTPVGRILRRFRIDEIPQLWNVLRGEMSFVGPRPERAEFVDRFVHETPLYERRLLLRPGLTGLAQIHGRYDTDYTHKLRYDLVYINDLSLATDLRILLSTVRTVLTGRGAV